MATIVKIDSRSKAAKQLLEYIKTLPFVEVEEKERYNAETEKVIANARKGIGVQRVKSSKELFKALGI